MARTGRPPETADTTTYDEATALQKRTAADLDKAQANLKDLEERLSTAALDDPGNFDKLADEVAAAKKGVRRLELAAREAEKRAEAALLIMRRSNEQLRIKRALRQLTERDRLGGEIEALLQQVGARYREMVTATDKARTMLSGLLDGKENLIGYGLGTGELERLIAIELWRADATLPGAERPIKLDGSPGQYVSGSDAPGMRASLEGCTELIRSVVAGERTYDGRVLIESSAPQPEPKPRSLFGRLLKRKADDAREEDTASAEVTAAPADAQQEALKAGDMMPMSGESEGDFLRRLAATPITPITEAEREALNAPSGPTRSAAEVQAELNAQGKYSTKIDGTGRFGNDGDW